MEEIKKLERDYKNKFEKLESEVNMVKYNYLNRFAEQKALIVRNKEIAEQHFTDLKILLVGIKKDIEILQMQKNNQ